MADNLPLCGQYVLCVLCAEPYSVFPATRQETTHLATSLSHSCLCTAGTRNGFYCADFAPGIVPD